VTQATDIFGASLSAIARAASLEQSSLDDVLKRVTESAARALGVARVNVWLHDEQAAAIRCVVNFDSRTGTFTAGEMLLEKDAPSYFRALREMRTIAAINAENDERTVELRESYLEPLGITTLLDAPILRSGKVAGVVCHEHVGPMRDWALHEKLFAGNVADIVALILETDRRLAAERERQEMERRLRTMERLEGLGMLAAQVAHDFNNMLAAVGINAELLMDDLPEGPSRRSVEDIRDVAFRAKELCRHLLGFSGKQQLTLEPVDMGEIATELIRLLRSATPEGVRLSLSARAGVTVMADPGALHQVALNLVTNAIDAVRERGGTIEVRVGTEAFDGPEGRRLAHDWRSAAGEYGVLEVTDDGVGMDEAVQQRIFEPFYTTKPTGHGLGLSSALGTIKAHRGALDLASRLGVGTTMRVLLPLTADGST